MELERFESARSLNGKRYHVMLRNDGWEIGSHGNTHRNLLSLTERELEDEFSLSKKVLEKIVGTVNTYAYPYGDSSPYTRKICQRFYNFAFLCMKVVRNYL